MSTMHQPVLPPPDLFRTEPLPLSAMPEPERHVRTLCSAAGFAHVAGAAAAAGVERRTLLWAMRGQRKPRRKVVARLASVLGVATELLAAIFEKARSERGARS